MSETIIIHTDDEGIKVTVEDQENMLVQVEDLETVEVILDPETKLNVIYSPTQPPNGKIGDIWVPINP